MTAVLRVVDPGLLTTVQDLGRPGAVAGGVPAGGAMDRFAHRAANLLAGNPPGDATLECTLRGPTLVAEAACVIALTGGDLGARVNGAEIPMWTSLALAPGDRLSCAGRRSGARAYVAIAGGFEADRWLASRSTSLIARRGGMHGRPLAADDELTVAGERTAVVGRSLDAHGRPDYSSHALLAIEGPHHRRLEPASREALVSAAFTVAIDSDRMGYRLEGPELVAHGDELLSFGLVFGAVQLPRSGRPILLMADHQTAGGYPVIATVVSASLPVAAQLAPGDEMRFELVSEARARAARTALNQALAKLSAP